MDDLEAVGKTFDALVVFADLCREVVEENWSRPAIKKCHIRERIGKVGGFDMLRLSQPLLSLRLIWVGSRGYHLLAAEEIA